ncbi:MAG TPA: hypothetical protein VLD61_04215, partial [Methylomirabilota bacterium]|nr:hypothetical protein [Methylomirabilota bacterium]
MARIHTVIGLVASLAWGLSAWAQAPTPPPPPRVEAPPPSPSPDAVWIAGNWAWRDGQWQW